jgi:hypothetical protein
VLLLGGPTKDAYHDGPHTGAGGERERDGCQTSGTHEASCSRLKLSGNEHAGE